MATAPLIVAPEDPLGADLGLLFQRHHDHCHADTPPGSNHMLDRAALRDPSITFLVARDGDRPVGMGALKDHGAGLGELKSMHVLAEARGRGAAGLILSALIDAARRAGLSDLSLETGAQDSFTPARRFYAAAGFQTCPPFASYRPDPLSAFMTLRLDDHAP
ncbi:MAG: GNAT family N-acetyltransferase [Paracoccus sp. (in: a-proteobacteria)]|nr:GNAT family N-acetyltransferase [Paracoccus sp. (in: a-proteobacteria)]